MRRGPFRYDFDLILAGDFRETGEVGATLASHIASLAGCDLKVGLLWLRNPSLPASTPVTDRLAALVRRHIAGPLPPDLDEGSCRVLLIYQPHLLVRSLANLPQLQAATTLVVLCTPLGGNAGAAMEIGAGADAIGERLSRRQVWGPATPPIRAQCCEQFAGLNLHPEDLPPLESIPFWRTERGERRRQRPILGRMLQQDDDRLPAKREFLLAAYPAEPDMAVRFLGGAEKLT